jgi:hypothetical protein
MRTSVIVALILISPSMQHVSAVDPPASAHGPGYYYTQGGRNDPFMNFATGPLILKAMLDRYDKLPSSTTEAEKINALDDVRMGAAVLIDKQPAFTEFFVKSHLPPDALAVSKPLFDALKDEKFQKERAKLVPYLEEGQLQSAWFEKMDIAHLRELYALYVALPFPTDKQRSEYRRAWDPPGHGPVHEW